MNIGEISISSEDEAIIDGIFQVFLSKYETTRFDNRDKILGIGQPGHHLFCYFGVKENIVYAKFKNRSAVALKDSDKIAEEIELTICLFTTNDYKNGNVNIAKSSAHYGTDYSIVDNEITKDNQKMRNYISIESVKQTPITLPGFYCDGDKNHDIYNEIVVEINQFINERIALKLDEREQCIINMRFDIENPRTLEHIGTDMGYTREWARQMLNKTYNKLKRQNNLNYVNALQNEYDRYVILNKIKQYDIDEFVSYLCNKSQCIDYFNLVVAIFFKVELDKKTIDSIVKNKKNDAKKLHQKQAKQNIAQSKIYALLSHQNMITITDDEFAKLATERNVIFKPTVQKTIESTVQCESDLQLNILEYFLKNNIFKEIKSQCLIVPGDKTNYYPNLQCLTHDNKLVVIDVKPMAKMGLREYVDKFNAVKQYCEKHSFGYLAVDRAINSYFDMKSDNCQFAQAIEAELEQHDKITRSQLNDMRKHYSATYKDLVCVIRQLDLRLSNTFCLTK